MGETVSMVKGNRLKTYRALSLVRRSLACAMTSGAFEIHVTKCREQVYSSSVMRDIRSKRRAPMNPLHRKFMLATLILLSVPAWAQLPCGVANQIYCQPWDGGSNLFSSQNDTNGFGNFATVYDNFTFTQTWDVESFHWVGGYFNPPNQGPITAWTLTFYNDNAGQPGNPIATGTFAGNGGETFIGNVNGFPIFEYSLFFGSFD